MSEPVPPISDEGLAKLQASMERYPHSPEARALAPILARLDAEMDRAERIANQHAQAVNERNHAVDQRKRSNRGMLDAERERDVALGRAKRLSMERNQMQAERDAERDARIAAEARTVFDREGDLLAQLGALRVENDRLRARAVPEGQVDFYGER